MTTRLAPDAPPALRLGERFRAARRGVVLVDDERVRAHFALPVPAGSTLRVHRRMANAARPQGLRLRAPVDLTVAGTRARDLALWSTTAPDVVEVGVDAVEDCTIDLWNTWRTDGIAHAWIGHAGMLVETDQTGEHPAVVLWCSDGVGRVSFDDLVVAVEIAVPASRPAAEAGASPATTSG